MLLWFKASTDRLLTSVSTRCWTGKHPCPEVLAIEEFKALCVTGQYWEKRFTLKGLQDHWGCSWRQVRNIVIRAIDDLEAFGYFGEGLGKLESRVIKDLRKLRGKCEKAVDRREGNGKKKTYSGEASGKAKSNVPKELDTARGSGREKDRCTAGTSRASEDLHLKGGSYSCSQGSVPLPDSEEIGTTEKKTVGGKVWGPLKAPRDDGTKLLYWVQDTVNPTGEHWEEIGQLIDNAFKETGFDRTADAVDYAVLQEVSWPQFRKRFLASIR